MTWKIDFLILFMDFFGGGKEKNRDLSPLSNKINVLGEICGWILFYSFHFQLLQLGLHIIKIICKKKYKTKQNKTKQKIPKPAPQNKKQKQKKKKKKSIFLGMDTPHMV